MSKVSIAEAQQRLPDLIAEAARGQAVLIVGGDGAEYQLVPCFAPSLPPRKGGGLKGRLTVPPDFDAPLADFESYS